MEVSLEPKRKRTRRYKIFGWIIGILLLLVIGAFIFVNVYVSRSLPVTSGTIEMDELTEDVVVERDDMGVPHITAENDRDLYIAQGYTQAQDRLFQMDLSRRQASGRLSEVIGDATVDTDKFFRTLGLRRAAEVSFTSYSDEARQVLEWYAEGVNLYMTEAQEDGKLPVEFRLLGYKPEKWTPVDSLTIGKYMAFDLGGHWQGQAFRYWAIEEFGEEKAFDLFPSYPEEAPTILSEMENLDLDITKAFAGAVIPPEFNGSNNWVISGEKTASGKPLLADDPHLSLATPSIWYQMHLKSPTVNVSGVIFAGVPGIILGHNENIAWGVTNTGPDVQDLYVEKRNPDNPTEFLYNEKWEQATTVKEPIKVKGKETIPYEVVITRHGPIISEFAHDDKKDTALSMRWTALDPSLELQAVLNMNRANTWSEFETALEDFHVPTQNFVVASKDGTIAYKANGKIPIRKKGDGLLPVPGWNSDYEWEGFIPFDELPRTVNPSEGFIATANNKVINEDYPYHISHHWAQPYRYMRIEEFIKEKENLTVKDMQNLQMDQMNLHAREFVPILTNALENASLTKKEKSAISLLKDWDFIDDKDAAAPLVFHTWMNEISTGLFKKQIPKDMMELFEGRQSVVDELIRKANNGNESVWFEEKGGYEKFLHTSLAKVIQSLQDEYGEKMEEWKWGDYHQVYFEHPVSSASSVLKWIFNKEEPIPVGGSRVTVQAASYKADGTVNHGASWRFTIDTNDMTKAYHIVGPGQSGHFKSEWYADQTDDWVNGEYHTTDIMDTEDPKKLILKAK
jgi:penicillin G amidase